VLGTFGNLNAALDAWDDEHELDRFYSLSAAKLDVDMLYQISEINRRGNYPISGGGEVFGLPGGGILSTTMGSVMQYQDFNSVAVTAPNGLTVYYQNHYHGWGPGALKIPLAIGGMLGMPWGSTYAYNPDGSIKVTAPGGKIATYLFTR